MTILKRKAGASPRSPNAVLYQVKYTQSYRKVKENFGKICTHPHAVGKRRRSGYFHSMRRAFMGEMEAARLAGMMAAKKEQMPSAPAATVRAKGSHEETP